MKAANAFCSRILILLLSLLLGAFCGCIKQDAWLVYSPEGARPTGTPALTPEPTATPEVLEIAPVTGSTFPMDEKGLPILDASTHYFTYYLVFSDLRIYEENGYTYLDGVCTNSYSRPLTGGVEIVFADSTGAVYGRGALHTAEGDMTLDPGETRIYAEILSETDVQLMGFSLQITTVFTPVVTTGE